MAVTYASVGIKEQGWTQLNQYENIQRVTCLTEGLMMKSSWDKTDSYQLFSSNYQWRFPFLQSSLVPKRVTPFPVRLKLLIEIHRTLKNVFPIVQQQPCFLSTHTRLFKRRQGRPEVFEIRGLMLIRWIDKWYGPTRSRSQVQRMAPPRSPWCWCK